MFNRIQQMVLWTELSNLFSVESDCPHREKFGYGGDIVAASEMAMLNFDMSGFYAKAVNDFADAVRPNGGFTETAPFVGISDEGLGEKSGPVGWGTAHPLLLWQLHQYYGDRRLLEEQYDNVEKVDRAFEVTRAGRAFSTTASAITRALCPNRAHLPAQAFYYLNVRLFAEIARVLNKDKDAAEAKALAEKIKAASTEVFSSRYRPVRHREPSVSGVRPVPGLVPPEEQAKALDVLVRDIQDANKGHLTTGIFGTKYMLEALTEQGRADVAFQVVNQRTFPGWGHMLEKGATTLWEHWEFSDNTFSHNHPMFGSVSEWFYKALAGIRPAPEAVGFNQVVIAPEPVGDLKWVKASYQSARGTILSEWSREGQNFNLHIQVPVGVNATVIIPVRSSDSLREAGRRINDAAGVRVLRIENGKAELAVDSGEYRFTSAE